MEILEQLFAASSLPSNTNHGHSPRFWSVAQLLESLSVLPSFEMAQAKDEVRAFLSSWRESVGLDMYAGVRLIVPSLDGSSECPLARWTLQEVSSAVAEVLSPTPSDPFRSMPDAPVFRFSSCRELSNAVVAMPGVAREPGWVSVAEVVEALTGPARESRQALVGMIRELVTKMSGLEIKWVIRIILRDMDLGLSDVRILHCMNESARWFYYLCNNLKVTVDILSNPSRRGPKNRDGASIPMWFLPPQQAIRDAGDAVAIAQGMAGEFYVEPKVSGTRMQIHYGNCGDQVVYFDSQGVDWSDILGDSSTDKTGVHSRVLSESIKPGVRWCVVDCVMYFQHRESQAVRRLHEMLERDARDGWEPRLERDARDRWEPRLERDWERDWVLRMQAFDVLSIPGVDISRLVLSKRKYVVQNLFLSSGDNVVPYVTASSHVELERSMTELSRRSRQDMEGLVVKSAVEKYMYGQYDRSWIKIGRPLGKVQAPNNVLLLVVGGSYATRRRMIGDLEPAKKYISRLCCAVKNSDSSCAPYVACATVDVSDGDVDINDADWGLTSARQDPVPGWLSIKAPVQIPDKIVDGQPDVVVEVAIPFVTVSEQGCQFRVVRVRRDLSERAVFSQDEFQSVVSRVCRRISQRRVPEIGELFPAMTFSTPRRVKLEDIRVKENLFGGEDFSFHVVGAVDEPERIERYEMVKLIHEHGGRVADSPDGEQVMLVSDKWVAPVMGSIEEEGRDVLHPRWVFECIRLGQRVPLVKEHYLRTSSWT